MNILFLTINILIYLAETNQINNLTSTLNENISFKVKELLDDKSFPYYIAAGQRDPKVLELSKYMVSVRTRNPLRYFGDNHFCGGVVISKKAVLTSGHCVMDKRRVLTRPRRILLVGGTPNRLEPAETTVQFPVKSIIANTNFVRSNKDDIAIIHLMREIPAENENLKIIKMPSQGPVYNTSCMVLGWGRMFMNGPLPALPMHVSVRIQEPWECQNFLKKYYHDGVLCAIGKDGDSPCLGDTGGPLICNGELTGIISFVSGCIWKNSPSLFTDIWHYKKWIEKHLNGTSLSLKNPKSYVILIFFIINLTINIIEV